MIVDTLQQYTLFYMHFYEYVCTAEPSNFVFEFRMLAKRDMLLLGRRHTKQVGNFLFRIEKADQCKHKRKLVLTLFLCLSNEL